MQVTCIMCPKGCELTIKMENDNIEVTGNSCPRGVIYGKKEVTSPERMVTTIKKYGDKTITLKTDNPVPKDKVFDCLKEIKNIEAQPNLNLGDKLIENVCGTTSSIVVTGISK